MGAGHRRTARHNSNTDRKIGRGSLAVPKEGSRGERESVCACACACVCFHANNDRFVFSMPEYINIFMPQQVL